MSKTFEDEHEIFETKVYTLGVKQQSGLDMYEILRCFQKYTV